MFGGPTIYVTSPEVCRRILMDDEHFVLGWPKAAMELMGRKSFIGKLVCMQSFIWPIFGLNSIYVHGFCDGIHQLEMSWCVIFLLSSHMVIRRLL